MKVMLTESDLHKVIEESVRRILGEMAQYRGDMVFVSYLNEPYDK